MVSKLHCQVFVTLSNKEPVVRLLSVYDLSRSQFIAYTTTQMTLLHSYYTLQYEQ